ncbi:PiggyBac transposable element-derived protein 2 [Eumeta japonica]|uniref:PiggyBac transposable element-derived protein 2 n=1 Tax=Eumeta variegata TaxID=151549 RepID=A0A4C1TW05_EUMVA|nr:PiggyBac transposable element-derived protein 2 [Eumeta japonica]
MFIFPRSLIPSPPYIVGQRVSSSLIIFVPDVYSPAHDDDSKSSPEKSKTLTQDDDQGIIDVEIEDTTLRQNETPDSLPGPSTSTAEPETEAQVTHQPAFKWTTNFDDLVHYIVSESVRYAHQNGREFTIEPEEMKAFFGMNLVMGYHVLPSLRDYWSTEPDMGVPFISNVMPRARFEEIRRNLHFCNNDEVRDTTSPNYDRAYKIRPIMDHFNASFQNALNNTEKQSIDEHMIKFKGHNAMKQYIKISLSNGASSYGADVMQRQNTKACGTVRTNRKHLPKSAPIDRSMKRGDIYTASFHGISYVKWMDNKAVHLLTNFLSPIEIDTVKRRKAGSADKIDVRCPRIVSHYNKNMGGVDLMDQRKVCYELDRRSKIKYYLRLFFDLFDISVNNAHTIYTMLHNQKHLEGTLLSTLQFRQVVARSLINGFSMRQRGFPTTKQVQ